MSFAGLGDGGSSGGRLPRTPALDGVRAIAVVAVMLYHGGVQQVPGGFLGVDVFFALSGFLITSLLLDERRRWGSVDLGAFWLRRARRLLPALYVVVAVVCVWTATMPTDQQPPHVRSDALATLLYVANWRFVFSGQSYFDQYATPSPFLHMWSLGIEEQWYVLFPLLLGLLLVLCRRRARAVAWALGALALASAAWMALLFVPGGDPSRVYYGTDTRAQELLVGAVLAVLLARRPVPWAAVAQTGTRRVAAAAGVLALLTLVGAFGWVHDSDDTLFRGGFLAVSALAGVLVVTLVLAPAGPVARLLGWRPFVAVGLVSYGLYLWHWPVDVLVSPQTTVLSGGWLLAVRLGLALVFATASYWLVERPIRHGALRRLGRPTGPVLAATSFVLVVLVAIGFGTAAPDAGALSGLPPAQPTGTATPAAAARTTVLLAGDSVAESLAAGFSPAAHPQVRLVTSTRLGCGLGPQQVVVDGVVTLPNQTCADWPAPWQRAVKRERPAVTVVLVGSWEVLDHRVGGRTLTVGSPQYATYLAGMLDRAEQVLGGDGRRMVLLDVPCYRQRPTTPGPDISADRNDPHRAAAVNAVLADFAAAHASDVTLLHLSTFLCPHGQFAQSVGGVPVRPDGVHPSLPGAAAIWDWLVPQLKLPDTVSTPSPSSTAAGATGPVRVFLVGDSVPFGLRQHFQASHVPGLQVGGSTKLGCGLLPYHVALDGQTHEMDPACPGWSQQWRTAVRTRPVDVGVIFLGIGEQYDRIFDGATVTFGTPAYERFIDGQLDAAVSAFTDTGATVVLPTVPCHRVPQSGLHGDYQVINDLTRVAWINDVIRRYAAAHPPQVSVYDLDAQVCPDGFTDTLDGVQLWTDGLHLTAVGADLVWSTLGPALLAAGHAAQANRS